MDIPRSLNCKDPKEPSSYTNQYHKLCCPLIKIPNCNSVGNDYTNPNIQSSIPRDVIEKAKKVKATVQHSRSRFSDRESKRFLKKPLEGELVSAIKIVIKSLFRKEKETLGTFLDSMKEDFEERVSFFMSKRGLKKKTAFAYALVLSFYSGFPDDDVERTGKDSKISDYFRNGPRAGSGFQAHFHYFVIKTFLSKALSHCPTATGECIRAVDLNDSEKMLYEKGSIMAFPRFSSSSEGNNPAPAFASRNTYFKILSRTGKKIKRFSNFYEEAEVLFNQFSTFLVLNNQIEVIEVRKGVKVEKTVIYLQEIELDVETEAEKKAALKKATILIDQNISDKDWEFKSLLLNKGCDERNRPTMQLIEKCNVPEALAFLRSEVGNYHLLHNKNLQVILVLREFREANPEMLQAVFTEYARLRGDEIRFALFIRDASIELPPGWPIEECTLIQNEAELKNFVYRTTPSFTYDPVEKGLNSPKSEDYVSFGNQLLSTIQGEQSKRFFSDFEGLNDF